MMAVEEFNGFGAAATSVRLRIDDAAALQLFAFRVLWIEKQWFRISSLAVGKWFYLGLNEMSFTAIVHQAMLCCSCMLCAQFPGPPVFPSRSVSPKMSGSSWRNTCMGTSWTTQAGSSWTNPSISGVSNHDFLWFVLLHGLKIDYWRNWGIKFPTWIKPVACCWKLVLIFPAAVSNALLLDERWMLGGTTRNPDAKNLHAWHTILKVNEGKQIMFIQRVFMLHEIASKKGGRASTNRLSLSDWQLECDRCCLLTHILQEMSKTVDDDGTRLFPDDLLTSLAKRVVEGTLCYKSERIGKLSYQWSDLKVNKTYLVANLVPYGIALWFVSVWRGQENQVCFSQCWTKGLHRGGWLLAWGPEPSFRCEGVPGLSWQCTWSTWPRPEKDGVCRWEG